MVSGHKGERNCAPIPAITQTVKGEGGGEAGGRGRCKGDRSAEDLFSLKWKCARRDSECEPVPLHENAMAMNGSCWVV